MSRSSSGRLTSVVLRFVQTSAGALVVGALACAGPRVERFDTSRQVLCPNQTAVLTWKVDGEPSIGLQLESSDDGESACRRTGIAVHRATLVAAKRGDEAARAIEFATIAEGATEPVVLRTRQVRGSEVIAPGEKDVGVWGGAVEIVTVAACGARALRALHADREAMLPGDGTPTAAFVGTPLAGAWELRSQMSPEEQNTPEKRPTTLTVLVTIRCKAAAR